MKSLFRRLLLCSGLFLVLSCGILNLGPDYISYAQYLGGRWGPWHQAETDWINGYPNNFVVYYRAVHPSEYGVKIITDGLNLEALEKDQWYSYSGTIEFFSGYSDAKEASYYLVKLSDTGGIGAQVTLYSHSRPARIDVMRKRKGAVFNVFFDDVGLAMQLPL